MFSNQKEYFDKLVEIAIVSLAKDGGSDDGFSLSAAIVNFVFQEDGIRKARDMYKRYVIKSKLVIIYSLFWVKNCSSSLALCI